MPEHSHKEAAQKNSHTDEIIEKDNQLVIRAFGVIRSTEDFMRAFVRKVMHKFGRVNLAPAIEIIVKELVTNAAKANFKKVFFAEHGIDEDNPEQYENGMARFRATFSQNMYLEYGVKARDAQLMVTTSFDFDPDRLIIEIRNNVPMTAAEERRAREKLRMAMECNDMGQFILENVDETEGAGLGLMLCITTLRSSDFDPRLLSISTDFKSQTVARVELPMHDDYVPARHKWEQTKAG